MSALGDSARGLPLQWRFNTVCAGLWKVARQTWKLWIDLPFQEAKLIKENNSFDPSDLLTLSEGPKVTWPFSPSFLKCFCNLSWVVNFATNLRVSFGIRFIQKKIYPRNYNSELSKKDPKWSKQCIFNQTWKHIVMIYLNCWVL